MGFRPATADAPPPFALFVDLRGRRVPVVGGNRAATQARIHALLLLHARAGSRVVRLHGGDPQVSGRGGEELDCLRTHDSAHAVVPGITAGLGRAAAAGFAPAGRRHARSFTLPGARGTRPAATTPVGPGETLAVYMGASGLEPFARSLVEHGVPVDTPCALIEHGTLPRRRMLAGSLVELLARAHAVQAPALLVVGAAAARAERVVRTGRCSDAVPAVATAA